MPNISLQSLGMCRKQNFEIAVVFKSDKAVLPFTFCFLFSPLFLLFFPWSFPFAESLVGFILVGKVFRKAFSILELDERSDRQFSCKFSSQCYTPFCLFLQCPCRIELVLVWFERSLHSAQVSGQSCPWPWKLMMSQGVEGTWFHTGSYTVRRLRGEWVM